MSGYVAKSDVLNVIRILQSKMDDSGARVLENVISAVEDMVEADVVPVVRCIEYKHDGISGVTSFSMHQGEPYISCENKIGLSRDVPDDGYCYCGEKVTECSE